ncbi:hypothetical protein Tco_1335092 [Tanacetum coccineum]
MQQFWYSIKKLQGTDSYEFLLDNKKCTINAEVFRIIIDICPRVEGVDFMDVPDDDTTLTLLIDFGYKGPLYKHTNMFVDHMHNHGELWNMLLTRLITRKKRDQDEKTCHNPNSPKSSSIKQHKSLTNLNYKHYHTIKEDGIETVDVFKESEPEPEPAKKKTSSKRRVKNKVTLSADDNIIFDDPDAALELAKSISKTEAEEAEEARQVHATHARIVTKSVPESAKKKSSGRSSKSVVIQDTLSAPKSKPATSKTKLKGAPSLTLEEQEIADIMQALKESKKTSRRQPGTRGSNEGTGSKSGVPDEEKDITEEKVILEWRDEQDSEYSDDDNDDVKKDDKDGNADDEGDDHISDTQYADDEDVVCAKMRMKR